MDKCNSDVLCLQVAVCLIFLFVLGIVSIRTHALAVLLFMPKQDSFSTLPKCTCCRRAGQQKQRNRSGCWQPSSDPPLHKHAGQERLQPTALASLGCLGSAHKFRYSGVVTVFVTTKNSKSRSCLSHLGFFWGWENLPCCSSTLQSQMKAKLTPLPSPSPKLVFHLSMYKRLHF